MALAGGKTAQLVIIPTAKELDGNLDRLANEFQCSSELLRGALQLLSRAGSDFRRYTSSLCFSSSSTIGVFCWRLWPPTE